jgi:predicted nucleic acid-binding protein
MILVDTSVWIHHLQKGDSRLAWLLSESLVLTHPFVIGELSLGNIENRKAVLDLLDNLPRAVMADHDEVIAFVEANGLAGLGMGWIDAHLLASARLSESDLFTSDKAMLRATAHLAAR